MPSGSPDPSRARARKELRRGRSPRCQHGDRDRRSRALDRDTSPFPTSRGGEKGVTFGRIAANSAVGCGRGARIRIGRRPPTRRHARNDLVPLMIAYQAGRSRPSRRSTSALAGDVRRFFAASVREPSIALDLAQLTFLELHRARHTYRPPRPVRPWVFGIAVNVRRRHRRDAASRARRETDAPDGDGRCGRSRPRRGRRRWRSACAGAAAREPPARLDPASRARLQLRGDRRALGIGAGAAKLRSSRAMRGLRALLAGDRGRDDE